nr:hypothetical protein [Tanacetum cinerariifolium]
MNDVVPLKYHIVENFEIQFGRKEFCLVTGLKFGVKYWADYNDKDEPIPFRRRMFPSSLDGKPIKGNTVLHVIKSKMFDQLHDDDDVSLCCVGILQLVLLGVEDRRVIPDGILRLMEGMTVGSVRQAKPDPIIGGPSTFQMPTNSSFYEVGQVGPSYGYNVATPTNWQTPYWQNPLPSHPGTSNWQSQMPSQSEIKFGNPLSRRINMMMSYSTWREHHPSIYRQNPYMDLPPTMVLPKKRGGKSKNKGKKANVSPFNSRNAFKDGDVEGDNVMIMGEQDTGIYFTYENVDPDKVNRDEYIDCMNFILNPCDVYLDCHMMGYKVPRFFWRRLVPHLRMAGSHSLEPTYPDGWLSGEHMLAWIQLLIRERPKNANWTHLNRAHDTTRYC